MRPQPAGPEPGAGPEAPATRRSPRPPSPPAAERPSADDLSDATAQLRTEADALGTPSDWHASLRHHARTFRFAGRWLPRGSRDLIAGLYTWCRFTDDLVDESDLPAEEQERRLDAWSALSRRAWEGADTGIALLDTVLGESAARGIPFTWAAELIEGVRMDLRPRRYADLGELSLYTRRVAGVVGAWMTQIFGVRDPWVVGEALRMGHAMQLTNILRDVGEDWGRGRLYLPTDLLEEHGLADGFPGAWVPAPGRALPAYQNLLRALAAEAHTSYDRAFRAIPALPLRFRVAMGVAARGYQGILPALEFNGWDNVHRRAHTTTSGKVRLGLRAFSELVALAVAGRGR
jgi:phytoene synthase